jgi:hypothetical protein
MSLMFPTPTHTGHVYTHDQKTWVWDGVAWHIDDSTYWSRKNLTNAPKASLTYVARANQQLFPTTIPDIHGATIMLGTGTLGEPVDVHVNGVRVVELDPGKTIGDFSVDRGNSTIDLVNKLPAGSVVQIDVLVPKDQWAIGSVNVHKLYDLDTDWSQTSRQGGMIDGIRTDFTMWIDDGTGKPDYASPNGPEELALFVDGVRQNPGVDYTVTASRLSFTAPPEVDSQVWGVWYEPAAGGGGGTIQWPDVPVPGKLHILANDTIGKPPWWIDAGGLIQIRAQYTNDLLNGPPNTTKGTVAYVVDVDKYFHYTGTKWEEFGAEGAIFAPKVGSWGTYSPGMPPPNAMLRIVRDFGSGASIDRLTWYDAKAKVWGYVDPHVYLKATAGAQEPDLTDGAQPRDLLVSYADKAAELKVWDAGTWNTVFSEVEINQWIAAARSFQGTIIEPAATQQGSSKLSDLLPETGGTPPDLSPSDVGSYWVWTGKDGYTIQPGDIPGNPSNINGRTLSPGDWIQVSNVPLTPAQTLAGGKIGSQGQEYVVIHGDILSKARADKLYGLQSWSPGSYENGSLVVRNGYVYRANTGIVATDGAPDTGGAAKWSKVALKGDLVAVSTPANLPAAAVSMPGSLRLVLSDPTAGGKPVIYCFVNGQWSGLGGAISTLSDVDVTSGPQQGNILQFNATQNKWMLGSSSDRGLREWNPTETYAPGQIVYHARQFWHATMVSLNQEPVGGKTPPFGTVLIQGSAFDDVGQRVDYNWNLPDASWVHRFHGQPSKGFVTTSPGYGREVITEVDIHDFTKPHIAIIQDHDTDAIHVYLSNQYGNFNEVPAANVRIFYGTHPPAPNDARILPVGPHPTGVDIAYVNVWVHDTSTLHVTRIVENAKNDVTKTVAIPEWVALDLGKQPEHVGSMGGSTTGLVGGTQADPLFVMTEADYNALKPQRGTIVVIG